MIRTVVIDNMEDLMHFMMEQERQPDSGRLRSSYFYRGMPDASFRLITSLNRNCGEKQSMLEMPILRNFTKYASIDDPTLSSSVWKQMIVGQHHGLPTRLLDWSHSSLMALNFADMETDLSQLDKHDCVVWRVDAKDLNQNLPPHYRYHLDSEDTYLFSVKSLQDVAGEPPQYDADMEGKAFVMLEPPSFDQRIINQYAFFSVIPMGMDDIEDFLEKHSSNTVRYVIRKELRWDLRDILDQFNVSERMIYPGLDGLTRWITRHYFVKR